MPTQDEILEIVNKKIEREAFIELCERNNVCPECGKDLINVDDTFKKKISWWGAELWRRRGQKCISCNYNTVKEYEDHRWMY